MIGDDVTKDLEDQPRQLREKKNRVPEEKKKEERVEAIFWWTASEAHELTSSWGRCCRAASFAQIVSRGTQITQEFSTKHDSCLCIRILLVKKPIKKILTEHFYSQGLFSMFLATKDRYFLNILSHGVL